MSAVVQDPDGLELRYLRQLAPPAGAKVLELGSGDGRLIWQYGDDASQVCGVDTKLDKLKRALDIRPPSLAARTHFVLSTAEALPFADDSFGLAIMAWSL
jgi:ubiquinone/menaquinone biosynthesis C-methylase UbiE